MVIEKGMNRCKVIVAGETAMSTEENATIQYNYYAHSSPVKIDASEAEFTPENAPELFPTVPVVFSQACGPEAQDLVTKVWTDLLQ
jgi:spermidine/putrescine transport system substrate-binding protein